MSYIKRAVINRRSRISKGFNYLLKLVILINIIGFSGCYPSLKSEVRRPEKALIPIKYFYPKFHDDVDFGSLEKAIRRNLEYLKRLDPGHIFFYGPHEFTCQQVIESQGTFLKLILKGLDVKELNREIKQKFRVYRAAGRVGNRRVLFTGYFEPIFDASLTPDERFKYPIYRMPDNLIKIDLSLFNKRYKGNTVIGRVEGKKVLPYYSRKDIEDKKVLKEKNLPMLW
ncbi:MltA domain-containing protein [Thermodesulfobacteriota bacterium]